MPPLKECHRECCSHGEHHHHRHHDNNSKKNSDLEDVDVDVDDSQNDKYGKRRAQTYHRRRQRMRETIILLSISLVVLSITYMMVCRHGSDMSERQVLENIYGGNNNQRQQRRRHAQNVDATGKQRQRTSGDQKLDADDGSGRRKSMLGGLNLFGTKSEALIEAEKELAELNQNIRDNRNIGIRWVNMGLVPSIGSHGRLSDKPRLASHNKDQSVRKNRANVQFYKARRKNEGKMSWEVENENIKGSVKGTDSGDTPRRSSFVDYSRDDGQHVRYEYPPKLMEPPARLGDYPKLMTLREIMEIWPQDELDNPPSTIEEVLIHFDYTVPEDREAAAKFRDAKLPFKMTNVPEVIAAGAKWTDDYLSRNFDGDVGIEGSQAQGTCQESSDNYFAFYTPPTWDLESMGVPPTRNNDWTFSMWAEHAHYADEVGLSPYQPHFYWQSGVDKDERYQDPRDWTFISRDLPSFSSTEANFFQFEPSQQKGIQCRFGERGVTAATHFDGGRNMVAMITGAKRYILSPPRECAKLGVVPSRGSAIYRHSMLNFGHINHMVDPNMPKEERDWMEFSGTANALSTVLKAGEVLYIPSHWFHYITSLQKSAQCNVRSGIDKLGDDVFGGIADVLQC